MLVCQQPIDEAACLVCQQTHGHLHKFRTFGTDVYLQMMTTELSDAGLISRIGSYDRIAIDTKYHLQFFTFYHNQYCSP